MNDRRIIHISRVIALIVICLCVKISRAQTCTGCTASFNTNNSTNISVNAGQVVCIGAGVTCSGIITMNGGSLCNRGTIAHLKLDGAKGTVTNYGFITSTDVSASLLQDFQVDNYAGASYSITNDVALSINATHKFTINAYAQASLTTHALSVSSGSLIVNTGMIYSGATTNTNTTYVNTNNISINNAYFSMTNDAYGSFNVTGSINFNNTANKSVVNNGTLTISDSFNIGGDGVSSTTVSVVNNGTMVCSSNFSCTAANAVVSISNAATYSSPGTFTVGATLYMSTSSSTIANDGYIKSVSTVDIESGLIKNNLSFVAVESILNHGTLTNNSLLTAVTLNNYSGATLNNNGMIKGVSTFSNTGTANLSMGSVLSTAGYTNNGSGAIHGPELTSTQRAVFSNWALLIISGESINSTYIDGSIGVFDQTLTYNSGNIGYGFDNVSNTSEINSSVSNIAQSTGVDAAYACSSITAISALSVTGPTNVVCSYGAISSISALLTFSYSSGYPVASYTTAPTTSYTWMPGNYSNPASVSPTSTTIYTVYANYKGCIMTKTLAVNVNTVAPPHISYTTTAFSSTNIATFNVSQTGATGGTYAITPACSHVTLDPSTGQIRATGINCFGNYTVTYCVPNVSVTMCEAFCDTTTISLQQFDCPIVVASPTMAMCPGDKFVISATGGLGTFSWSPPPTTFTGGLSCTSCPSPTLTYEGVNEYTVRCFRSGQECAYALVDITPKTNCEEQIIGCCFSNYGAFVWLGDSTYLNIHCNLVNDFGIVGATTYSGNFTNPNGKVRVELDWIHNAKNELYTAYQGTTTLFGFNQKIRGNSVTHFNDLWLHGNGIKSLFVDAYAHKNLDLAINVLDLMNNKITMANTGAQVIRTSGYATDGVNGYFFWALPNGVTSPQYYLYPLGATASGTVPFRYRPYVLANNSTSRLDTIGVNFMNVPPSLTTDPVFANSTASLTNNVNNKAPNVLQTNHDYYHKVRPTATSTVVSDLLVKSFYLSNDGQFQSIAEWKMDPMQTLDWWAKTPGSAAYTVVSSDPGTPGMIYAQANGTLSLNHPPFILARGGFYLNTTSFGGGNGTMMTVTATPSGTNPTPTGGGLNNPYGTGANSGNNGTGGNTIFTPSPVSGDYVINVTPASNCEIPGRIKFTVDQNGNINPANVMYGLAGTSAYLGSLSEELFTVDNQNSGITFSATPQSLLKSCVNSITVCTSGTGSDYILNLTAGESLLVKLPAAAGSNSITYSTLNIYNAGSILVPVTNGPLVSGTNTITPASSFVPGVYRFELTVYGSGAPPISETIKGQFIVTP